MVGIEWKKEMNEKILIGKNKSCNKHMKNHDGQNNENLDIFNIGNQQR